MLLPSRILILSSRVSFGSSCHYEHFLILFRDPSIVHDTRFGWCCLRSFEFRHSSVRPNVSSLLILASCNMILIRLFLSSKFVFAIDFCRPFHLLQIAKRFPTILLHLLGFLLISIYLRFCSFRYEHGFHIYVYGGRYS